MDTYQLTHYELPDVLSKELEEEIIHILESSCYRANIQGLIRSFKVFLTLYIKPDINNLCLEELFPSEKKANELLQAYAGFIHTKFTSSVTVKYRFINIFKMIFNTLLSGKGFRLYELDQSTQNITDNIKDCINLYLSKNIDKNLDRFYEGWNIVINKKLVYLNLTCIHKQYGYEFTKKIYDFLCKVNTNNVMTFSKYTIALDFFFGATTKLYPNLDALYEALNPDNCYNNLLKIKTYIYLENIKRNNSHNYAEVTYKKIIYLLKKMKYTDIFPYVMALLHKPSMEGLFSNIISK